MGKHKTAEQTRIMVEFMEKNPETQYSVNGNRNRERELWKELTKLLNSHGPPINSTEKWKKTWSDMKFNVRKKIEQNKEETETTNNGTSIAFPISNFELRVANIAGMQTDLDGIEGASAFGLDEDEISIENSIISMNRSHSPESDKCMKMSFQENSIVENIATPPRTSSENCSKSTSKVLTALTEAINKQTLETKRHNEEMEGIAMEQNRILTQLLKLYSLKEKK